MGDLRKSLQTSAVDLQTSATGKDGHVVEEWDYLNHFFKRYNKVLLDEQAIERERDRLRRENTDLRSILKQYLDGISVNEDVINAPTRCSSSTTRPTSSCPTHTAWRR